MTKENSTNKSATTKANSAAPLPDWLTFPTLSAVFDPSPAETIDYLAAKSREYQSLKTAKTPADRARARLIAASYARTGALLQELESARKTFLKQQETQSAETR
jgi:hypothetical protein